MPNPNSDTSRTLFWQQQIKVWQTSGQNQKAFCRSYDLNYARFGDWVRKLRRPSSEVSEPKQSRSAFVPVTLKQVSDDTGLHLVLPGGLEIRGIQRDNLSLVEQLLKVMA